jgi:hypothetical protein
MFGSEWEQCYELICFIPMWPNMWKRTPQLCRGGECVLEANLGCLFTPSADSVSVCCVLWPSVSICVFNVVVCPVAQRFGSDFSMWLSCDFYLEAIYFIMSTSAWMNQEKETTSSFQINHRNRGSQTPFAVWFCDSRQGKSCRITVILINVVKLYYDQSFVILSMFWSQRPNVQDDILLQHS